MASKTKQCRGCGRDVRTRGESPYGFYVCGLYPNCVKEKFNANATQVALGDGGVAIAVNRKIAPSDVLSASSA